MSKQIKTLIRETSTGGLITACWMRTILEISVWALTKSPITWMRRLLCLLRVTVEKRRSTFSKVQPDITQYIQILLWDIWCFDNVDIKLLKCLKRFSFGASCWFLQGNSITCTSFCTSRPIRSVSPCLRGLHPHCSGATLTYTTTTMSIFSTSSSLTVSCGVIDHLYLFKGGGRCCHSSGFMFC